MLVVVEESAFLSNSETRIVHGSRACTAGVLCPVNCVKQRSGCTRTKRAGAFVPEQFSSAQIECYLTRKYRSAITVPESATGLQG